VKGSSKELKGERFSPEKKQKIVDDVGTVNNFFKKEI